MKLYITLLCFMLAVIIIFTAFGIPYASNNFVGTVVTVEQYLNSFSGWLLNFYNTIHGLIDEWLPKIAETLRPLGDLINSIVDILKRIDEKFGIVESVLKAFEYCLDYLETVFRAFDFILNYFADRDFSLSMDYWRGLSLGLDCLGSDNFYTSDGKINYQEIYEYIDAIVFKRSNKYSYILTEMQKENILSNIYYDNSGNVIANDTILIGIPPFMLNVYEVSLKESEWYIQVPSMELPESYCSLFSNSVRVENYYSRPIPIAKSNLDYTYSFYDEDDVFHGHRRYYYSVECSFKSDQLTGIYQFRLPPDYQRDFLTVNEKVTYLKLHSWDKCLSGHCSDTHNIETLADYITEHRSTILGVYNVNINNELLEIVEE